MHYLYRTIEPGECEENDRNYGVLQKKKALCCGYSVTLFTILEQYGYQVKCITAIADNMPHGRGRKRIDTHEVVELKFNNRRWVLDPMADTAIPHSFQRLLKNPELIPEKEIKDSRYLEREYYSYDTEFFYKRVKYYKKKRICLYKTGYETLADYIRRMSYVYLFHVIPDKLRIYNIWKRKDN